MHFTQKRRSRLGCLGPQPGDGREEATISTPYVQPPPPRLPRRGSRGGLGEGLKPGETEIPLGRADCGSQAAQGQPLLPTGDTCPSGHRSATQAAPAATSRFTRAFHGAEPTARPHLVQSGSPASGRAEPAGSAGDCFCLGPAEEAAFVPRASPHRVRPANPALLARPGASLDPTQAGPGFFPLPALHSRALVSLARSHSSPHSPRVARLGV